MKHTKDFVASLAVQLADYVWKSGHDVMAHVVATGEHADGRPLLRVVTTVPARKLHAFARRFRKEGREWHLPRESEERLAFEARGEFRRDDDILLDPGQGFYACVSLGRIASIIALGDWCEHGKHRSVLCTACMGEMADEQQRGK